MAMESQVAFGLQHAAAVAPPVQVLVPHEVELARSIKPCEPHSAVGSVTPARQVGPWTQHAASSYAGTQTEPLQVVVDALPTSPSCVPQKAVALLIVLQALGPNSEASISDRRYAV